MTKELDLKLIDGAAKKLPEINALMRIAKCYWGYDKGFVEKFMATFSLDASYIQKHTVKLLILDNNIIGFYAFIIHDNQTLELDQFFVHPNFINKGVEEILWELCCLTAEDLGKNEFILWSDPNTDSFYLNSGCEKIDAKESFLIPQRNTSVMSFRL